MKSTAFVLVHGAWHGGWCWAHVAPLLRAKGHQLFCPALVGAPEETARPLLGYA
jgi:hypothetical protein